MIVLFGGAFNPPTKAHLEIIKELNEKFILSKILIIPTFKTDKKVLLDFKHRLNMLKILTKKIKNIEILDYERKNEFIGTYFQLLDLTKKYGEKPYLVIGADNFKEIDTWINSGKLLSEFELIIFNRNHLYTWNKINKYNEDNNTKCMLIDFKNEISASSVRENLEDNKDNLTPEIYKYLKKKKLLK